VQAVLARGDTRTGKHAVGLLLSLAAAQMLELIAYAKNPAAHRRHGIHTCGQQSSYNQGESPFSELAASLTSVKIRFRTRLNSAGCVKCQGLGNELLGLAHRQLAECNLELRQCCRRKTEPTHP